ncbi:hypothetical protein CK203_027519 [Vitis vinifera]|uniref:Uncharacterized protein n=1 Tax=Vitis vinifera TaxID=29760 RepID=A0A438JBC7_VITVI|nr:hypothetical protein CK203_027519 [Vitis vinifera]
MSSLQVEMRTPPCAAWTDDQIKRCLAAKIHTYGKYGHVQPKQPTAHMDEPPHEATCSHSDDPTESSGGQTSYAVPPPKAVVNVEANKEEASTDVHPCNDQFMGNYTGSPMTHSSMENDTTTSLDVSQLISQHSCVPSNYGAVFDSPKAVEIDVEEGTGSKPVIPTSRRRYKWTAKRYDCGMFVIYYMQYWNWVTLAHSHAEMQLYKLRLVVNLLMNEATMLETRSCRYVQCEGWV